jgi:hypothetical protein
VKPLSGFWIVPLLVAPVVAVIDQEANVFV